jgi:hypothetical protein
MVPPADGVLQLPVRMGSNTCLRYRMGSSQGTDQVLSLCIGSPCLYYHKVMSLFPGRIPSANGLKSTNANVRQVSPICKQYLTSKQVPPPCSASSNHHQISPLKPSHAHATAIIGLVHCSQTTTPGDAMVTHNHSSCLNKIQLLNTSTAD